MNTMAWLKSLFIIDFLIYFAPCSSTYQNGEIFTTPGYPIPYSTKLSQRTTVDVDGNQGVAVVFEQFLASNDDCVTACPANGADGDCFRLCGDAMDHGLVPKIMRIPGSAEIRMLSFADQDGYPHSGISAKIIKYELDSPSFFNCGDSVSLVKGSTFYLISESYPLSPTIAFNNCSVNFSAESGIRFAVYDFNSMSNEVFHVSNAEKSVDLSGFETEDEPVFFSFSKTVDVSFTFTHHSFTSTRFYILVNAFDEDKVPGDECILEGDHYLHVGDTFNFGTPRFGGIEYTNRMNCHYRFNRADQNSLFAVAIYYESEKCCDTMDVTGLSEYVETYQGYQYPKLIFSQYKEVTMNFTSDETVGALGFNGTINHVGCNCVEEMWLSSDDVLSSPGYDQSLSYCPNLLCRTKIHFNDTLNELHYNVDNVKLRSYTLTEDYDHLTSFDAYDHRIVNFSPTFIGPSWFISTASPIMIEFKSNSYTMIPLENVGKGFSIPLNIVKKTYKTKQINFDDNQFMYDISNIDFTSNNSTTFEFIFVGRPNTKISVYFFSKINNFLFVDVFDGATSTSNKIDNKELYSNIQENGESFSFQSSSNHMVLHIRINPSNLEDSVDFQAMVTDFQQDFSCGDLAHTLKRLQTSNQIPLIGKSCMKILHITDSSYDQNAFISLSFDIQQPIDIYLGLANKQQKLLAKSTSDPRPLKIFSNYITLSYTISTTTNVIYGWGINNNLIAQTMQSEQQIIIMSPDYKKQTSSSIDQRFSVQLEGESNVQTGISLKMLDDVGNGNGVLTWSNYDGTVKVQNFKSSKLDEVFSSCGSKITVEYQSDGGTGNGLYAMIERANLTCSLSPRTSTVIQIIVICLFSVLNF